MNVAVTLGYKEVYSGRRKGALGAKPPRTFFKNYSIYLYYKCDRRPFWHSSAARQQTKFRRILCFMKGIHLVLSLWINYINKKKYFKLNIIEFTNAPYIKLHSSTFAEIMKTVSKKMIPKTQEILRKERLAVEF